MSILGITMRMLEMLVIYGLGFVILSQGFVMRFRRKITIILCSLSYGSLMTFWGWIDIEFYKFYFPEFLFAFVECFVLILFFYRGSWLQIFTQCFLYWSYIACYRYIFARIGVMISEVENLGEYAENISQWYFFEVFESAFLIMVLVVLFFWMRGKSLIQFHNIRQYGILFLVFLAFGSLFVWWKFVYGWEQVADMLGVSAFCIFSATILTYLYCSEKKNRELQMEYNQKQMTEQYEMLRLNYEEKRRAIHDEIQQNALILEYLNQNRLDEAKGLLQIQTRDYQKTSIPCITGLPEVDLLLHHKKKMMEQKGIRLQAEVALHTNPFTVNEWCILFGNLMDNAMEAVEQLPLEERIVLLKLQNRNQMFFLEIQNPYKEELKHKNGRLISQKTNPHEHGIGLESSRAIVKKHSGEMVIKEEEHRFRVQIVIYSI